MPTISHISFPSPTLTLHPTSDPIPPSQPILLIPIPLPTTHPHPQPLILLLQLLNPVLQPGHLLLGPDAELLDDLEEAPETQDDDEGGDFFEDAVQQHVGDEAGEDDEGVEDVEFGGEVLVVEGPDREDELEEEHAVGCG